MLDEQHHVTGVPALTAFSMHTDLGRIIQGILMEFQNHPPKLSSTAGTNVTFPAPSLSTGASVFAEPEIPVSTLPSSSSSPFKSLPSPSQFPQLNRLSNSQLEELLKEDGKLQEFVEQLPEVVHSEKIKEHMVYQNEELARKTLELRPVMEERKHLLLQKMDVLNVLKQEFEQNSQVAEAQMGAYDPSTLLKKLCDDTRHYDEESENVIVRLFFSGQLKADLFVKQFMEKKTMAYIRRVKAEKMHAQLKELNRHDF